MLTRMRLYITFIFSFLSILSFAQSTKYHAFEVTTSDFKILEWNINKSKLPNLYIEELIDEMNRVVELKFYSGEDIIQRPLCWLTPWYKFQYPNDSTIVVNNFNSLGEVGGDIECGIPSKTIFLFNPNNFELKKSSSENILSDRVKEIWLSQFSDNELMSLIEQSKTTTDSPSFIDAYLYSYQKLNGHFLIDSKIDLERVHLSEEIKKRVLETLPKWYTH